MRTDSRGMRGRNSLSRERLELLLAGKRMFSPAISATRLLANVPTLSTLMLASSLAPQWSAFAQEQSHPQFEVTSIHLNRSERPESLINLADRFHIQTRWGTQELPFYPLTLAETGPKFKEDTEPFGSLQVSSTGGFAEIKSTRITEPSLFADLREQPGLKRGSGKNPVQIPVIDHAEQPDAN